MSTNKYFILPLADLTEARLALIIGDASTARKNIVGTKYVVKLPVGTDEVPGDFGGYTEYNNAEILVVMEEAEWAGDS